MSGTIVIKPIEAKLSRDTDTFGKMDPYCQIVIGTTKHKGEVCESGGKNPRWKDTITIKRNFEPVFYIELFDKDTLSADDIIGVTQVDINSLSSGHSAAKWYPLFFQKKPAGEILLELTYTPDHQSSGQHGDSKHHHHSHWGGLF